MNIPKTNFTVLTTAIFVSVAILWQGSVTYACGDNCKKGNKESKKSKAACPMSQQKSKNSNSQYTLQTNCPILGGKINKSIFADVHGQRIYACCKGCIAKIKANPEGALQKLAENNQYAQTLQKKCPIMGGHINKKLFVEYKGRRIYVCCPGCISKIKKNPAKYAKKVAEDIVTGKGMKDMKNMKGMKHH